MSGREFSRRVIRLYLKNRNKGEDRKDECWKVRMQRKIKNYKVKEKMN